MAAMEERRRQPRIQAEYDYFMISKGPTAAGKTFDISPLGAGLYCEHRLDPGMDVDIKLYIKNENLSFDVKGKVIYCLPEGGGENSEAIRYLVGVEFEEGTREMPFMKDPEKESTHSRVHTISIDASAPKCYELIADYERYPEWVSNIKKVNVIDRYPDGRGKTVEFIYNAFLKDMSYTNVYDYDDDNLVLGWRSAEGGDGILNNVGNWTFRSHGDDRTTGSFEVSLTFSFMPAQRILDYASTILMRKEMKNFKRFVESRR